MKKKWLGIVLLLLVGSTFFWQRSSTEKIIRKKITTSLKKKNNLPLNTQQIIEQKLGKKIIIKKGVLQSVARIDFQDFEFKGLKKTMAHKVWEKYPELLGGIPEGGELVQDRVRSGENSLRVFFVAKFGEFTYPGSKILEFEMDGPNFKYLKRFLDTTVELTHINTCEKISVMNIPGLVEEHHGIKIAEIEKIEKVIFPSSGREGLKAIELSYTLEDKSRYQAIIELCQGEFRMWKLQGNL